MNQLSSIIDFSQILSQKAASNAYDKALKYINDTKLDKQQSKRRSHDFLTLIHNHLQDNSNSAKSRFNTLLILKLVTQREDRMILSVLTTHSLLKYLTSMAKQTDPFSPMQQKGRYLFDNKQLGNDYIRLILQSLKVWGLKFSSNKKNQQSHFKKAYNELLQKKVVIPADLKFYSRSIYNSVNTNQALSARQNETQNADTGRFMNNKQDKIVSRKQFVKVQEKQVGGMGSQMKLMQQDINIINEFISLLQGNDYQRHCFQYHKFFSKESVKYEAMINQLISTGDQKGLKTALAINEFYTQEDTAYKQFLADGDDYYSYIGLIKLKGEELNTIVKKTPQPAEISKQYARKEVRVQVQTRKNNLAPQTNDKNKEIVSELITKLNQKSKKPMSSFRDIKDSLSKQKSVTKLKRSTSGMRKSSVSKFGKSITKSRIAGIFTNPPNPHPQDKRYQGELIDKNYEMESLIKNLTRNQGIRRFITSNFKSKNPLFENSHFQIGFKSEAIYDEVNEFKALLSIELYIGNKTEDQINRLSLEYKGGSDVLLYATPKNIKTYLQGGYQIKQELLVVPLKNHLSFIHLYLKYSFKGESFQQKIILPNSIIKLTKNEKLSKKEFVQCWNASTIYRTKEFKLTEYISPDSLNKYIPCLSELSSYDQFVVPDSETDYQLGCQVMLMQDYEGVLRISVRPNLNVVIQIGITVDNQQAHQGFIHFLQTLQMLLTHADHQN